MKKVILATLISGAMSTSVLAADLGHGKINFSGSIIDAPCSITADTDGQTVELGQISNMALVDGGKSSPSSFDINLENCDLTGLTKGVQLTFTGAAAGFDTSNKTLGIVGTGSGAGIQITNGGGNVVTLGEPTSFQNIQPGNNTLRFSAYLVGNGEGIESITPGDFTSVADFTLSYE